MYSELAIIFTSGVVACMVLGTIGCTIIMIIRSSKGRRSSRAGGAGAEETRMIQEIHHGLSRMEQRIEALETLMLDEDRSRRKRERFEQELSGE